MTYYKVLSGYFFQHGTCDYSYIDGCCYKSKKHLGFKVFLLGTFDKLFHLRLGCEPVHLFGYDFPSSTIAYYHMREVTESQMHLELEVNTVKQVPKDKARDTIFILEGGDIHNHLFSVSKYGCEDHYEYKGDYEIHDDNWERF